MTATTLDPKGEPSGSQWVRRVVLVTLSLGLLVIVGAVFTRVIAARVPEQRATLEKLITERTGLAVRFDNVHFAWGLDGTSAVFERVELTDPSRGRVRVVAPQLRVEFDTWDFLKHQQFSLGHVRIASPDIEIVGDPEPATAAGEPARRSSGGEQEVRPDVDEATAIRRFITWAELMPIGRVEVEGARVHLMQRGERAPRHSFTLSQANLSRGTHNINAFGTMQLSQDIGQSLFVSARLENLGSAQGANGEVRLIARRLLLDKLDHGFTRGRGTLDASIELRDGLVHEGRWQASAREFEFEHGSRFDHFTVRGSLRRERQDVLLEFSDLQVTRGAKLERAPRLAAHVTMAPGSIRVTRASLAADRVPFMAAEFLSALLAPQRERALPEERSRWAPSAGELRSVRLDSNGNFHATLANAEFTRAADRARVGQVAATITLQDEQLRLAFDPGTDVALWMPGAPEPRRVRLQGVVAVREMNLLPILDFEAVRLTSDRSTLAVNGHWGDARAPAEPLSLALGEVDRALLGDTWSLLGLQDDLPLIGDLREGRIVSGQVHLLPQVSDGDRTVDWPRSRGSLTLADLASVGEKTPNLAEAAGRLEFSRGATQLRLDQGRIEDLEITKARVDWPSKGAPRMQATLQGELQAPLIQRMLAGQGIESITGAVALDLDARGEEAFQDSTRWRVTARIEDALLPFPSDLPPIEKLRGTVRYNEGELRGVALDGEWLGGAVKMESRRNAARNRFSANLSGTAEAAPFLSILGREDAASLVDGRFSWTGQLNQVDDGWQITMDSQLTGIESRLPAPFAKTRNRALGLHARIRLDDRGVRAFDIAAGRDSISGRVTGGVTTAGFDLHGVTGEWVSGAGSANPRLDLHRLELRHAAWILGAAGASLPEGAELAVDVQDLRHVDRSLGAMRAQISRDTNELAYRFASPDEGPHELSGNGKCDGELCAVEFEFETRQLAGLILVSQLPGEWPKESLRASGELRWETGGGLDPTRRLTGTFDIEARGRDGSHQLASNATIASGQIHFIDLQGLGPEPDEVLRGTARVNLLTRRYDVAVDYEKVALAAAAVPSPARAGFARAWSALRGTAARRGWAESPPPRRVEWHGTWD
jgi:uncharacterized protein YhdP